MPTPIIIPPTQQELNSQAARAQRGQDRADAPAHAANANAANSVPVLRAVVRDQAQMMARALDRITAVEDENRALRAALRQMGWRG